MVHLSDSEILGYYWLLTLPKMAGLSPSVMTRFDRHIQVMTDLMAWRVLIP